MEFKREVSLLPHTVFVRCEAHPSNGVEAACEELLSEAIHIDAAALPLMDEVYIEDFTLIAVEKKALLEVTYKALSREAWEQLAEAMGLAASGAPRSRPPLRLEEVWKPCRVKHRSFNFSIGSSALDALYPYALHIVVEADVTIQPNNLGNFLIFNTNALRVLLRRCEEAARRGYYTDQVSFTQINLLHSVELKLVIDFFSGGRDRRLERQLLDHIYVFAEKWRSA